MDSFLNLSMLVLTLVIHFSFGARNKFSAISYFANKVHDHGFGFLTLKLLITRSSSGENLR